MTQIRCVALGALARLAGMAQSAFTPKITSVSCTVTVHTNGGGAQGGTTTTLRGMVLRTYDSLAQVELASIGTTVVVKERSVVERLLVLTLLAVK